MLAMTKKAGKKGAPRSVATKKVGKKAVAKKAAKKKAVSKTSADQPAAKQAPAKKKSSAKKGPSEGALAMVDPAKKRLYDDLMTEIAAADKDEKNGWDRKYEAVGEFLDASLFLLSPHGNAKAWCKAVLEESYRNASRNARVAKHFSPDDEVKYTIPRLEAYLSYVEAKTGGPIKGALKVDLAAVRIPVERAGKTVRLPLPEVDPAELAALAREESGEGAEARARRSPVEQAFAGALHAEKALAGMTVRFSDGALTLGRIPLTHLDLALKILKSVDWEAELPARAD